MGLLLVVFIALGANLPSLRSGAPVDTLAAALDELSGGATRVLRRSSWYRSAPVPASSQPDFVNAVAQLESDLAPAALLARLLEVEALFGRVRGERWGARCLDLDLLDWHGTVCDLPPRPGLALTLPHPRLHERAFVLLPLAELAPGWHHPVLGRTAADLAAAADPAGVERLA